jgi:autotransporter-associated beta strand protein
VVNSTLDLNGSSNTIGSLSGTGTVLNSVMGTVTLTVGQDNTDTTFSGVLQHGTGGLALTKIGTGTLTLTNTNTYNGGTNLNGGTLAISSDANLGTGPLSFNGGTLEALAAGGGIVSNKAITLNSAGGTFLADAGMASTLSGPIAGTGSWTKTRQGTLILSGANTYSGGTTISAGTLQLGNGGTTGSITGNVLNNGVLAFDRSGTVAFGGVISGTVSVTQIGTGTTILTGSNTYTGGTTISAGTLQAGSATALSQKSEFTVNSILDLHGFSNTIGSLTGTGIVLNDGATAATLTVGNDNSSTTFAGVLQNGTSALQLTKSGTGTLTLPGKNTYTGTTTINAGSLIVDGSIASQQTIVNAGGFLGGHGIIGGNLSNSGTVGPGDSPGTLTVANNYTQNATGTLRIQVGGLAANQHDLLAVNGHVTLGGTLQLVRINGFNLQPGNQISFLTAQNGVSGAFSTVQNDFTTGTLVQGVITTSGNPVVLEGQQGSFTQIPGVTFTGNQSAVGKMLNSAVGDPRAAALIAFLNSQPVGNLPHDYDLIAPTQISSVNATAVSVGKVQATNLGGRMANIRGGSTGFSSAGFGISGGAASFGEGFEGVSGPEGKSGPPALAPTPGNRWGVFLTGLGEFTNVDSTPNAPGYDVNTGGFTLGVDYRLTPNFCAWFERRLRPHQRQC